MAAANRANAEIIPIDSEHNAIFQCLRSRNTQGDVQRIVLTASGGPFRGCSRESLASVTPQQAVAHCPTTLAQLPRLEQSLLASRARLEMAQLLQESDWAGAVTWARAALASFTRLGATHEANVAAALLRQLGVQPRTGPRLPETISQREMTVLTLLAHGLSNREIAERLVISEKTVEHHVSQVLSELGVRNRAEAAALAVNTGILEQNKGSQ